MVRKVKEAFRKRQIEAEIKEIAETIKTGYENLKDEFIKRKIKRYCVELAPVTKEGEEHNFYSIVLDLEIEEFPTFELIAMELLNSLKEASEMKKTSPNNFARKFRNTSSYNRIFVSEFNGIEEYRNITDFSVIHIEEPRFYLNKETKSVVNWILEEMKPNEKIVLAKGGNNNAMALFESGDIYDMGKLEYIGLATEEGMIGYSERVKYPIDNPLKIQVDLLTNVINHLGAKVSIKFTGRQ